MSDSPPTYAARDEARAYVARVLSRPPANSPARVYLITPPDMRASAAWEKILPAVRKMLPGCPLLEFRDLWPSGAPDADERIARLVAEVRGALVIPRAWRDQGGVIRHVLGYAARAEAAALVAEGLPVLVLTPAGIVGWPDVRVRTGAPPASPWLPLEVDFPAPPPGEVLPTVAASYRALGLPRPQPRRPRRAPGRPARPGPRRQAGPHEARRRD